MTESEKLKDLFLTYTDGVRQELIKALEYIKVIEMEIDRRIVCQDGVGFPRMIGVKMVRRG